MSYPFTTYSDYPKSIAEALERAGAWWKYDETTNTLHIISRNTEEPLTNSEKIKIAELVVKRKHAYKRIRFGVAGRIDYEKIRSYS